MLTRTQAKRAAEEAAAAATPKGKRSRLSEDITSSIIRTRSGAGGGGRGRGRGGRPRKPYSSPRSKVVAPKTYISSESLSAMSSATTSEESSGDDEDMVVTPDSSFELPVTAGPIPITPQRNHGPPTTPPRLSPRKLQRSPRAQRWIHNGSIITRIIYSEESAEEAQLRSIRDERGFRNIAERELERLLRERETSLQEGSYGKDFDMDTMTQHGVLLDPEGSKNWVVNHFDRSDTESVDTAIPQQTHQGRRLGPEGTEIIDPMTFLPYPNNVEAWRQGLQSFSSFGSN